MNRIILLAYLIVLCPVVGFAEETAPVTAPSVVVPCQPLDAISLPKELLLKNMDPWAPMDAVSKIDEPGIPPQLRVVDTNAPFDVLASADDSADPKLDVEKQESFAGGGSGNFRCAILMYHGFHDPPRTIYEISSYDFEQQCQYLADSGVEVIPLSVLVDALTTKQFTMVPDRSVVITVDDGYYNFYSVARPILKRHGFPATMNIYTAYIGSGKGALSWENLREMSGEGWLEVGSHSRSHPNLARSKGRGDYSAWLSREIVDPKSIIESQLGQQVKAFCYPYGSYSDSARAVVRNAGYEAALSVHPGACDRDSNPQMLPRYGIYRSCTLSKFARYVQGGEVDPFELNIYTAEAEKETVPLQ